MHDFRKLKIWSRSKDLTIDVYKLTLTFPKEEMYGIISQIRRSASSVPANIAEGSGRATPKDFANFLNISLGSLNELLTFIEISKELNFLKESEYTKISNEIDDLRNMIYIFSKNLKS